MPALLHRGKLFQAFCFFKGTLGINAWNMLFIVLSIPLYSANRRSRQRSTRKYWHSPISNSSLASQLFLLKARNNSSVVLWQTAVLFVHFQTLFCKLREILLSSNQNRVSLWRLMILGAQLFTALAYSC